MNDVESESPLARAGVLAAALRLGTPGLVEASTTVITERPNRSRPSRRSVLCLVHAQVATTQLMAVELLDRLGRRRVVGELHERESPRTSRVTFGRYEYFTKLADLGEELLELGLCGREIEIPYE
jgi:hypothetical protein